LLEKAEAFVRDNPFVEFRLDYIPRPATAFPKLKRFLDLHPYVLAIATCRRAANGGKFKGSLAAELDVLTKAAASGCQLVDLEIESATAAKPALVQRLRENASLILSFHDFRATRKLDDTFERMRAIPADFYKVVSTATTLYDNVQMMKFLERQSATYSMVGICMGEQGLISRVLGVRAGSVFTFGAATAGEETAPGQLAAGTLRQVYRIEQVDAATRVYGVAGDPVAHSLSPLVMNAAFRRENVNAVYLPLHAKTMDDLLACIRDIPLHGISITMPYKESILKHLDNFDAYTQKTGACNTVVRGPDGKLYGFNTDVAGVVQPLEQRITLAGAKVLVIGAGGAARAAVFGLRERSAEVSLLNRTAAPAQKLARQAHARVVKRADLKKLTFDAIINATPIGMNDGQESPLKQDEINARYVLDMVYVPAETRLVQLARARNVQVIPGSEMFVQQAARQFEIWTGKPAPVAEMEYVVRRSVAGDAHGPAAAEKAAKP
jgi:3-dehydroquinate dehydratase / shikimate dehydrogenase